MRNGEQIRSRRLERKVINSRIKAALLVMGLCFTGLTCKVFDLQINNHEKQSLVARGNSIKQVMLSPTRGDIVDRNGILLATTRPSYDLTVVPDKIPDYKKDRKKAASDYIELLSKFVFVPESEKVKVVRKILRSNNYSHVIVSSDISNDNLSSVLANLSFLDGVSVEAKRVRQYPYKGIFLSPIGYVGRISTSDLQSADLNNRKLISSDYVGKMGLEKLYDDSLYGKLGIETVALNARGRVVERQIAKRPVKGETLRLTIDADMQVLASELMEGQHGAVVVSDVHNGDLLTALSAPDIDPNRFVVSTPENSKGEMFSSDRPLYNRVIRGQYSPASTIKPFMALIGLEGGFVTPEKRVWSGPYFSLAGHRFRDWKRSGHGWLDLEGALQVSSDVYFYKLSHDMGIDFIHDALSEFGFGGKTGIELGGEKSGLLPSESWKKSVKHEAWFGGETLTVGIGQGFFMATPLQINTAISMLINGGTRYKPELILGETPVVTNHVELNPSYVKDIMTGMERVVYSDKGTARRLSRIAKVRMAGKTGTSQVFSTRGVIEYKNKDIRKGLRDHAIFIGFAPIKNPKIALTVIVENGGSGSSVAAPIAQKLANLYYEKYLKPKVQTIAEIKDNQDEETIEK
ncbi:penicillin-binding protein 2 [Photobacterium kishitanii]|uniref:Penicillin-binding protein 2 n=1 Tax=Photobacterium kishitanii TaxID=318456 RepID=A0A2T3KM82_9GAMM|nr:penicillin-binding protein 2 [Photobacterium kishitanii]PSV00906.1 penicillin-binding protein 2 [Photobacterium kishitanii]